MNGLTKLRSMGLVVTLATGAMLGGVGGEAHAGTISMPTNGTAACKSTTAAGASKFYYNHTYLWNNGTTNQYLTCVLPDWNLQTGGNDTVLQMSWAAGATGGTVTCTAQIGGFYLGANQIVQGNTRSATITPGGSAFMTFVNPLTHTENWQTTNIICNVPPSFKLGLIEHQKDAPTAW